MELVDGRVVTQMPPGGTHGEIAGTISSEIRQYVRPLALGRVTVESGFRLRRDPDTVLAPDVAFVETDRLEEGRLPDGYIDAIPTLVVEVVSPNDRQSEVFQKVGIYLDCGVQRVWVVREKNRTVIVYDGEGATTVVAGDGVLDSELAGFTVAGFELKVSEIFA